MTTRIHQAGAALLALATLMACQGQPAAETGGDAGAAAGTAEHGSPATFDESAIRSVAEEYHRALAAGDSLRAIELLHPEVLIFEGGHAETLAQYRAGHLAADIAFAGAVRSETVSEQVVDLGDAALYMRESRTSGTFRDRAIDSRGTETLLMVRTDAGWRIRHIHWSST
jgi:ketosteroid isomerase-like protein